MNQISKPHHHGNLREALVLAGLELIESEGVDALSLRKCAVIAGVSHAAPAHHFGGLKGLEAAIIAHGHGLFAKAMIDASLESSSSPRDQLEAVCMGYISFATTHTDLFKFMFQPHDVVPAELNELTRTDFIEKTTASYQILREACAPFEQGKSSKDEKLNHEKIKDEKLKDEKLKDDNLVIETLVWSLVHGYAMLFCGRANDRECAPEFPEFSQLLARITL